MSKGKGSTPPEITTGSYVAWDGGKGRVDLVVTSGKVPGVDGDTEGTEKSPAARVVVWEDGKATGKKIGASTHTLRRIPPIKAGKSAAPVSLVEALAEHVDIVETLGLPDHARVTGKSLTAVYERGVKSWPGAEVTSLSSREWGLGRVGHFVKVARGDIVDPHQLGNDTDLLDPTHPAAAGDGQPNLDADGQEMLDLDAAPPADASDVADDGDGQDAETPAEDAQEGPAGTSTGQQPQTPTQEAAETPADEPDGDSDDEDAKASVEGKSLTIDQADIDSTLADLMAGIDD